MEDFSPLQATTVFASILSLVARSEYSVFQTSECLWASHHIHAYSLIQTFSSLIPNCAFRPDMKHFLWLEFANQAFGGTLWGTIPESHKCWSKWILCHFCATFVKWLTKPPCVNSWFCLKAWAATTLQPIHLHLNWCSRVLFGPATPTH